LYKNAGLPQEADGTISSSAVRVAISEKTMPYSHTKYLSEGGVAVFTKEGQTLTDWTLP